MIAVNNPTTLADALIVAVVVAGGCFMAWLVMRR